MPAPGNPPVAAQPVPPAPADARLRRTLRWSIVESMHFSLMVGLGEVFLLPLAVRAGLDGVRLGLVATLPLLLGAAAQFASGSLIRAFGSRRRMVVAAAALQASVFPALAAIAAAHVQSLAALLILACVYWASALAAGPAWSSWIGALTEGRERGRFFGRRSLLSAFALLAGYLGGGFVMDAFTRDGDPALGYVAAFLLAFAARLVSAGFLWAHHEPATAAGDVPSAARTWADGRRFLAERRHALAFFLASINGATFLSAASFAPYLLETRGFDAGTYARVTAAAILGRIGAMYLWGEAAERAGPRRTLIVAATAVGIVPLLWLYPGGMAWVYGIQAFAGAAWGGFELAGLHLLLASTAPGERVSYTAWYNALNGVGQVAFAALGGLLLDLGWTGYLGLFAASGLLRLGFVAVLAPGLREPGQRRVATTSSQGAPATPGGAVQASASRSA